MNKLIYHNLNLRQLFESVVFVEKHAEITAVYPLLVRQAENENCLAETLSNITALLNPAIAQKIASSLSLTFIAEVFPSGGGVSAGRGGRHPIPRNTRNFMSLPYNPKLKQFAREMRKARNLPEVLFWKQVRNKQFKGLDFDRQKVIGHYIADFYCSQCNVVVEIDGSSHDNKAEYDARRDRYLQSQGLTVIHIPVREVMRNLAGLMKMLSEHLAFDTSFAYPTPPKTSAPGEHFTATDILRFVLAEVQHNNQRINCVDYESEIALKIPFPNDIQAFRNGIQLGQNLHLKSAITELV